MKLKMYRVGKKVGLIRFDVRTNRDVIDRGKIVARRLRYKESGVDGRVIFEAIYAVRLEDGGLVECKHEELWTRIWKEDYGARLDN